MPLANRDESAIPLPTVCCLLFLRRALLPEAARPAQNEQTPRPVTDLAAKHLRLPVTRAGSGMLFIKLRKFFLCLVYRGF